MFLPLRSGLILGVLVFLWTLAFGYTGWYRHPRATALFVPVAILLQLLVMALSLWQTRRREPFIRQVLHGMALSVAASVVIFLGSYLSTTVIFPTYFADLQEVGRQAMVAQGAGPEQVREALKAYAAVATPFRNAFAGVMGTLMTGFLLSLVLAAGMRRKGSN